MIPMRIPSSSSHCVSDNTLPRIEPLLYETLYIDDSADLQGLLDTKPAKFLAPVVKAVFVASGFNDRDDPRIARLLSACGGLEYLTVYGTVRYAALAHLRPHRLSTGFGYITGMPADPFLLPFFARITHLELYCQELHTQNRAFEELPTLTHLALFSQVPNRLPDLLCILRACRTLEILLSSFLSDMDPLGAAVRSKDDPRLFFCEPQPTAVDRQDYAVGDDIWQKVFRAAGQWA